MFLVTHGIEDAKTKVEVRTAVESTIAADVMRCLMVTLPAHPTLVMTLNLRQLL